MTGQLAAGIDIGGTHTVVGFVDSSGSVFAEQVISTRKFPDPYDLIREVSEIIKGALSENPGAHLIGCGIGAPNGNYFSGSIEFAPNLEWEGKIPLASWLHDLLGVPVKLTNDANAAALGEKLFGDARELDDFIFITLGTGLGSGIFSGGKLLYGHDGFAGELGHVIVKPGGRTCGCGRKGCLETYASATGLRRTYFQLNPEADERNTNSKWIYEKAMTGEAAALESFRVTGDILGAALANAVAVTSPSVIFLFGGLANAGELIMDPARLAFERDLLNIYRGKVRLQFSALPENHAAILGAASLIWHTE